MHYLLIYELAPDYLESREEHRDEHLKLAWNAHESGDLILGGALKDPTDNAVLLFKSDSPEIAESFAKSDPYVIHGVAVRWEVRPWHTVVGDDPFQPVKPV